MAGNVALAVSFEIVTPIVAEQTMARPLGGLGGVNKTVTDLLKYARADKKSRTTEESTNDRKVQELIDGLWTPLNTVLAEFEGEFTDESHGLLEAYGEASHLKLAKSYSRPWFAEPSSRRLSPIRLRRFSASYQVWLIVRRRRSCCQYRLKRSRIGG